MWAMLLSVRQYYFNNIMGERLEDIDNFLPLSDRVATAGQPTEIQYPAIAAAGYQTVINLALKESINALLDEGAIATSLGLEYIHIPVLWDKPTLENFQKFVQVMNTQTDRKIFIHCAANKRVSAFMYLYHRIEDRLDEATAKLDLAKIWVPNKVWQTFIDNTSRHSQEITPSTSN